MKKTLPYLKHVCVLLLLVLITELTTAQVPDSSFGANGVQTLTPHSDIVYFSSAAFESNKIVIGLYEADEGYFRAIDIFRLTENGTLDSSFGPNGLKQRYDLEGGYIAVQKDNKIVVLGTGFDDFEEPPFPIHVYRYKHNGQYDSTFGTNGDFSVTLEKSNEGRQIAIQKNGNIVIGGDLQTPSKQTVALIQITPDGKLDSSFGTNGLLLQTFQQTRTCTALRILPDNKILAGYIYTDTTGVKKTCLIRYRKNGKVDSSFGVNGILINNNQFPKNFGVGPYINIALLPDSSIIEFAINSNNSILYRYSYNGKPYASFGNNGSVKIPNSSTLALALDSDNNILIDRFINSSHYVARYKRSGKIDSSFGTNGLLKTPIDCDNILVQPDGKLVISGLAGFDAAVVRYRFNDESTKRQNNSAVTQKNITALFYPNPVKNILHIRGLDANTNYQIKIIDAAGNIVSTKEIKGNCDYNVSQLMRGVYYLNIFGNNNTASITKFVKE